MRFMFKQPKRIKNNRVKSDRMNFGRLIRSIHSNQKKTISVAPMVDVTNKLFRHLIRAMSKNITLYTEMIVSKRLSEEMVLGRKSIHFGPSSGDEIVQIGGSDPQEVANAARLLQKLGYQRANLNCGCPSRAASHGTYGCALLLQPQLVAEICERVQPIMPISVKMRTGVNSHNSYESLASFVQMVSSRGGVSDFVIHARDGIVDLSKSRSSSWSSKQRFSAPLKYATAMQLVADFPHLNFELNGELNTLSHITHTLDYKTGQKFALAPEIEPLSVPISQSSPSGFSGAMIGRKIRDDPMFVALLERDFFGGIAPPLEEVLRQYQSVVSTVEASESTKLKPVLPLFSPLMRKNVQNWLHEGFNAEKILDLQIKAFQRETIRSNFKKKEI